MEKYEWNVYDREQDCFHSCYDGRFDGEELRL
jgi:hypothetical protein